MNADPATFDVAMRVYGELCASLVRYVRERNWQMERRAAVTSQYRRKKPVTSVTLLPEDLARLDLLARRMKLNRSQVVTHLVRRAQPELESP